jgi:hypothetical protein
VDYTLIVITIIWTLGSIRAFWLCILYLQDSKKDLVIINKSPKITLQRMIVEREIRSATFSVIITTLMLLLVIISLLPIQTQIKATFSRADLILIIININIVMGYIVYDKRNMIKIARNYLRNASGNQP